MTAARMQQLRAHAEAHRHFTIPMALELLEHAAQLEARLRAVVSHAGCPPAQCSVCEAARASLEGEP